MKCFFYERQSGVRVVFALYRCLSRQCPDCWVAFDGKWRKSWESFQNCKIYTVLSKTLKPIYMVFICINFQSLRSNTCVYSCTISVASRDPLYHTGSLCKYGAKWHKRELQRASYLHICLMPHKFKENIIFYNSEFQVLWGVVDLNFEKFQK